jgi:MFS family permease
MQGSGRGARARQASRSFAAATRTAARAGAAAGHGATRTIHRMTSASGAGRTGLAHLIELTAAAGVGDAFVAVALAGTLFFSTSVNQARGRVALALLITMAPFALLAPFIGPMLDRVQRGRRYVLLGTLLARGLLCWGMAGAVAHNDPVTLLPAAFGVLVLQKAFGVTRASVTPRLLPAEITLVKANARCALAALIATSAGAGLAAGISVVAGGGPGGASWVLRIGSVLYLLAMIPGLRLPDGVDEPEPSPGQPAGVPDGGGPGAGPPGRGATGTDPTRDGARTFAAADWPQSGTTRPLPASATRARAGPGTAGPRMRRRFFPRPVGPVVSEAIAVNITLRAYSGFMIFFLAFLLRTVHFGTVSDKLALGEMIAAAAAGGFAGTATGAALRARAPQLIIYVMLAFSLIVSALCAAFFGLWAVLIVAFAAAAGQNLVKLALDSTVQREVAEDVRSSTFAASETLHQLSWVIGGLLGLAMSLTNSGVAGLTVAAAGLVLSFAALVAGRRRRILAARGRPGVTPA